MRESSICTKSQRVYRLKMFQVNLPAILRPHGSICITRLFNDQAALPLLEITLILVSILLTSRLPRSFRQQARMLGEIFPRKLLERRFIQIQRSALLPQSRNDMSRQRRDVGGFRIYCICDDGLFFPLC